MGERTWERTANVGPQSLRAYRVWRFQGLGDIRRRSWKRSDSETGSGRGRADFRSVPEVGLVDPHARVDSDRSSPLDADGKVPSFSLNSKYTTLSVLGQCSYASIEGYTKIDVKSLIMHKF